MSPPAVWRKTIVWPNLPGCRLILRPAGAVRYEPDQGAAVVSWSSRLRIVRGCIRSRWRSTRHTRISEDLRVITFVLPDDVTIVAGFSALLLSDEDLAQMLLVRGYSQRRLR